MEVLRWSAEQYEGLAADGYLPRDERVELIEGQIRLMAARGNPHIATVGLVSRALMNRFGASHFVAIQCAVQLGPFSLPEPDIFVASGSPRDYATRKAGPADITLVVEVSDTTLAFDRGDKAELYARAGVCEYWIVNIQDERVERRTRPAADGTYGSLETFARGDTIVSRALGEFIVDELLI